MRIRDHFDDDVRHWLIASGPADIRADAVDAALERAARLPQRRGFWFWLEARPTQRPSARVTLVVALTVLALAAAVIAAGTLLRRTSPLGGGGWISVSSAASAAHILSPDGSVDQTFTSARASCPHLSPDGSEVGYAVRFSGFYVTRLADTQARKVGPNDTSNTFGYREGVWSPNRAYLSFLVHEGGGEAVRVLSVFGDGASSKSVFSTTVDNLYTEAAWSPDSTRFAVAHGRDGKVSIDVVDLAGRVQQSVGPFPYGSDSFGGMELSWSPDGTRLAYIDRENLEVIALASGTRYSLGPAAFADFYAASPWSPDGNWLAVPDPEGNLRVVRADGSASTAGPALAQGVSALVVKWSTVADVIAIRTAAGLFSLRADGSDLHELKSITGTDLWDFAWSPDGTRIVVAEDGGSIVGLQVTNMDATGQAAPLPIALFPSARQGNLCVSWDAPIPR